MDTPNNAPMGDDSTTPAAGAPAEGMQPAGGEGAAPAAPEAPQAE